jgi:hypothetical protein
LKDRHDGHCLGLPTLPVINVWILRIKPESCTRASPLITTREAMYYWMLPIQNEIGGIYFLTADMSDKIYALLLQMHTADGIQDKINAVLHHIQGRMDVA